MGGFQCHAKMKMDEVKDKVVVLLGKTGVGKSSLINSITHKKICKVGESAKSCTKDLKQVDMAFEDYNYYFIDTPGLDDGKGDENNISKLGDLRTYPRINALLICIKFDDIKLSDSLKKALQTFMDIFPAPDFWEHVIVIRTWSIRGSKFAKNKKKYQGQFLNGIKEDNDLNKYMNEKKINTPSNLKEFYIDSDDDLDLDEETKIELKNILKEIQLKYPVYKESKFEDKEIVFEEKNNGLNFLHIITERHITFKDFNDEVHEINQKINEERYNLDCIRPLLIEVKRIQDNEPRGPLCWKYYFKTHYNVVKIYSINDKNVREEYEMTYRWEKKDNDEDGENYREALENRFKGPCCSC